MKQILFIIMAILCMSIGFAQYLPGQSIDLRTSYSVDGEFTAADANITITLPNSSIDVNNTAMTELSTGKFQYIYTFPDYSADAIGNYYMEVVYYNQTDGSILGSSSDTFNVGDATAGTAFSWSADDSNLEWGTCPASFQGIFMMWMVLLVLIVVGIIGMMMKNIALVFITGFLLILATLITWGCGAIVGIISVLFGIVYIMAGLSIRPLT